VYNSCIVKTIRIAAYSVRYNPTFLLLSLGSATYLLPSSSDVFRGQLRCEEMEFLWWFRKLCVDRESGMLEWPTLGDLADAMNLLLLHRKLYPCPWLLFIPLHST